MISGFSLSLFLVAGLTDFAEECELLCLPKQLDFKGVSERLAAVAGWFRGATTRPSYIPRDINVSDRLSPVVGPQRAS